MRCGLPPSILTPWAHFLRSNTARTCTPSFVLAPRTAHRQVVRRSAALPLKMNCPLVARSRACVSQSKTRHRRAHSPTTTRTPGQLSIQRRPTCERFLSRPSRHRHVGSCLYFRRLGGVSLFTIHSSQRQATARVGATYRGRSRAKQALKQRRHLQATYLYRRRPSLCFFFPPLLSNEHRQGHRSSSP